jgi:hypothetical protein
MGILASIEAENPIVAGRTSAELDRLNNGPLVGEEVEAAKDRMRQSEDGAPGLDGISLQRFLGIGNDMSNR